MIARNYLFVKSKSTTLILTLLLLTGALAFASRADAAIIQASNTITTSRPSASSPFSANAASTVTQASILDNGSFFLASDSAQIRQGGTGSLLDTGTIVSSQSAALTTVFFAEQLGTAAGSGSDVLIVPITAMHTLQFTTQEGIANGGTITLTYPGLATGDANNEASPSASTFQFNNLDTLDTTHIQLVVNNTDRTADATFAASNPSGAGDGGDIVITIATGVVAPGAVVEIFVGCTSNDGDTCDAQAPILINPTKSATAGTADIWKVGIQISDGDQQSTTVAVGTIESVTVRATVDPTLTFTIAGIANATAVNTGNTTGCLQVETTNAGLPASATEVNLGLLANTPAADTKLGNIAAQRLTVTTNAAGGYVLTATSSGSLINPASGFYLDSSTTPAAFPASGADWFGIHACGLDTYDGTTLSTTFWNTTASDTECGTCVAGSTSCPDSSAGTNVCKYGWPTQTGAITIAADPTGPIGNSITAGNGITSVSYAGSSDPGIPAGQYRSVITYVATPTFN